MAAVMAEQPTWPANSFFTPALTQRRESGSISARWTGLCTQGMTGEAKREQKGKGKNGAIQGIIHDPCQGPRE